MQQVPVNEKAAHCQPGVPLAAVLSPPGFSTSDDDNFPGNDDPRSIAGG